VSGYVDEVTHLWVNFSLLFPVGIPRLHKCAMIAMSVFALFVISPHMVVLLGGVDQEWSFSNSGPDSVEFYKCVSVLIIGS
jgi:peptidoglycan/LPS O-acetylase OafA/YrhL